MVQIAIIDTNQCVFNDLEKYVIDLLYRPYVKNNIFNELKTKINDYIWSVIKNYVVFVNVSDINNEEFLQNICNILTEKFNKPLNNFYFHTENSFSFPKKHFEIMHCEPLWNDYKSLVAENINNIGCYFSFEQKIIENRFISLCYKYTDTDNNYTVILDNIAKQDIVRIIKRRHIFSAILIQNDEIIKYYYNNKNYLIEKIFGKNCKITETKTTILNYNLKLYSETEANIVNKIGTRLYGEKKLFGDVLIFHEFEENVPANLSIHELKRLNILSYGRMYDRKLKVEEINTDINPSIDFNSEKKNSIKSRYTVVNNRMKNLKIDNYKSINKCINCNSEDGSIICSKCFRIKYCSIKCYNEYMSYHFDDCVK